MTEDVQYIVSLKDMMSGKLDTIDGKAKGLEITMGGLAKAATVAFALIGGVEFLKSSVSAYNESAAAGAQLTASLQSTGYAAGLTQEALDAQAEALMKVSTFDDDAITGAQSLLLTFTNIRGEIFEKTTPAILDLATKMGGDLKGATIQVGKALNDPVKGITALQKVGVSFSETQKEVIKNLAQTGHTAEAQQMILAELNKEFGGSAAAAAGTYQGQLTILQHQFQNVKEEIGGVIMALVIRLKPTFEWFISAIQDSVTWLKNHTDELKAVAFGIGAATAAWALYEAPALLAASATFLIEGAFWAVSTAMKSNPIGLVITAFGLLAAGVYYAWEKSEQFRGGIMGVWEVMKGLFTFILNTADGVAGVLMGALTLNPQMVKDSVTQIRDAWKNLDISGDFDKGYNIGVGKFTSDLRGGKPTVATPPKAGAVGDESTSKTKKLKSASDVTGQKVYTINIKIDSLIKDFKVSTTTINESATKVKEVVTQALLSAVNDSQIIAE